MARGCPAISAVGRLRFCTAELTPRSSVCSATSTFTQRTPSLASICVLRSAITAVQSPFQSGAVRTIWCYAKSAIGTPTGAALCPPHTIGSRWRVSLAAPRRCSSPPSGVSISRRRRPRRRRRRRPWRWIRGCISPIH